MNTNKLWFFLLLPILAFGQTISQSGSTVFINGSAFSVQESGANDGYANLVARVSDTLIIASKYNDSYDLWIRFYKTNGVNHTMTWDDVWLVPNTNSRINATHFNLGHFVPSAISGAVILTDDSEQIGPLYLGSADSGWVLVGGHHGAEGDTYQTVATTFFEFIADGKIINKNDIMYCNDIRITAVNEMMNPHTMSASYTGHVRVQEIVQFTVSAGNIDYLVTYHGLDNLEDTADCYIGAGWYGTQMCYPNYGYTTLSQADSNNVVFFIPNSDDLTLQHADGDSGLFNSIDSGTRLAYPKLNRIVMSQDSLDYNLSITTDHNGMLSNTNYHLYHDSTMNVVRTTNRYQNYLGNYTGGKTYFQFGVAGPEFPLNCDDNWQLWYHVNYNYFSRDVNMLEESQAQYAFSQKEFGKTYVYIDYLETASAGIDRVKIRGLGACFFTVLDSTGIDASVFKPYTTDGIIEVKLDGGYACIKLLAE